DASAREALVAKVAALSPAERESFVGWAQAAWEGGGWERLAPALARIGTTAAAEHLVQAAITVADGGGSGARAALEALGDVSPDLAFAPLWDVWADRGSRRYFAGPFARSIARDPYRGLQRLHDKVRELPPDELQQLGQPLAD